MRAVVLAGLIIVTCGASPSRSQDAPATNCDTYAASDLDPQRKAEGIPFDKINPALAIPACESAVRKYPNSIRLIHQLARAYAKHNDFNSAFVQYRKAADQGYALAEYNLGVLYEKALGVAKDDVQAVALYRKAAEQGFVLAQFNLGNIYRTGQGVPQDYAEALKWLLKAAEQGNAPAMGNLGVMYANGQGVPPDYAVAASWWLKAANQGDALSQMHLGSAYYSGQGVPQNYSEAVKWLRLSADHGVAMAQYILGVLYEGGVGIAEDDAEAIAWFRKAASQGDNDAKKKLAELEATRKCEQLAGSKIYFVATCIVAGMDQTRQLEGLQGSKNQLENAQAGLHCTPEVLSKLRQKATRVATTILKSGAISKLMDFSDAMTLECKKAATSILKSD
jgi:hypothetical protein